MNRWCDCKENAKLGSIEGIEFEVCLSCEEMSWQPTETKNFFGAAISLQIDLDDPTAGVETKESFIAWLDAVLANYGPDWGYSRSWKLYVDRELYDEDELLSPVEDGALVTIKLIVSDWNFEVVEDGEESGWHGIQEAELSSLSAEELAKKAIINLWSHMSDYLLMEMAKMVMEHIENHNFKAPANAFSKEPGSPVIVSYDSHELSWTLDEDWVAGSIF